MNLLRFVTAFAVLVTLSAIDYTSTRTIYIPSDYVTIQEGIDVSNDGDTVLVSEGIYRGLGNTDLKVFKKEITIVSESGPKTCIIDCEGSGRGITFRNYKRLHPVFEGFTILRGNVADLGGGINCIDSSPIIRNCVIRDNQSQAWAGGIFIQDSSLLLMDCVIEQNRCSSAGGGILCVHSAAVIDNCVIQGNYAGWGGGIDVSSQSEITNCLIEDNTATYLGGGLYIGGEPLVANCKIIGNSAVNGGGGLVVDEDATLFNCLISGNSTQRHGAGIGCYGASPNIVNCTIVENIAEWDAGGLDCFLDCYPSIQNCIIWGNIPNGILTKESVPNITYSDIQNGWEGEGNIAADPLFISGFGGAHYLSNTSAGQSQSSSCIDRGKDRAGVTCIEIDRYAICLNEYTTRTDEIMDTGSVDMGYHYALGDLYPSLGVRLAMPEHNFSPGDICWLKTYLNNNDEPMTEVPLFIILDVYSQYWYWDTWSESTDYTLEQLPIGSQEKEIVSPFCWPDTGNLTMQDLVFWGALTNSMLTEILGEYDQWKFNYGP